MDTITQPDETKNKNSSSKLLIGLIILGVTLICSCVVLMGLLLVFVSSNGVAPLIYTLF